METKYTPGPWTIGDTPAIVYDDNACEVAIAAFSQEAYKANARLIAAAPELLEALQALLIRADKLDQTATHDGLQNIAAIVGARAAIAKATGNG